MPGEIDWTARDSFRLDDDPQFLSHETMMERICEYYAQVRDKPLQRQRENSDANLGGPGLGVRHSVRNWAAYFDVSD